MPYMWVEPEQILRFGGVSVYHTYRNNLSSEPLQYHYTTDNTENAPSFDIRDLPSYAPHCEHICILRKAIANGEIKRESGEVTDVYMGKPLDFSQLMFAGDLVGQMKRSGANDSTLTEIRDHYVRVLGFDPIWRYPLSDEMHLGAALIPVQEGFLYLPYDYADTEEYECYCLESCSFLDSNTAHYLQRTMLKYAVGLHSILNDIFVILSDRETTGNEG